jgi:hypothetical protein
MGRESVLASIFLASLEKPEALATGDSLSDMLTEACSLQKLVAIVPLPVHRALNVTLKPILIELESGLAVEFE